METQRLNVKDQNDESKCKSIVRGSCPPHSFGRRVSLVPGQDCTTLKGRTTIVFWDLANEIASALSCLAMTGGASFWAK